MESNYVFLCGVMWCAYGQEEAGRELLRATLSRDLDISTLAWAMFAKGKTVLRGIARRTLTHKDVKPTVSKPGGGLHSTHVRSA